MSMPLARYLKDFSAPQSATVTTDDVGFGASGLDFDDSDFPALSAPDPIDLEAERREAYAEGHEAAERALREQYEGDRQALDARHRDEVAALQKAHEAATGRLIADCLRLIASQVAASVAEQSVAALAPLISRDIAENTVKDLAQLIEQAVMAGDAGVITVRGPLALFEMLKDELPESAERLSHVEADDLDLTVDLADTVLVTRISAFAASLKKVLG
ncbi:GTPase [Rhizobium sp. CG5]|uniref:GTPase n=1 Tax=Rhizobium sp. CG5 TaxID=2726076 RepID=UPI002033BD54|nr:GTPase [Rhizobium sp. CG5]MCM2472820.1 GTPase [Rhizobium sp. CG5]